MKILPSLRGGIRKANFFLYVGGVGCLIYTLFVTLIDVTGRYFRKPLPGALEMCELALVSMVFLSIAHTQAEKGHVYIDFLFAHIPPRVQGIIDVVTSFLGLCLAVFIAWAAIPYALSSMASGENTDLLDIPLYPFKFLILIGGIALSCQFIFDIADNYRRIGQHRNGNST